MNEIEKPIVIEELFDTPIEEVWNAITIHEEMIQWFFDNIPAFEPRIGFTTQFAVHSGERKFTHLWKLLEVEPKKKITYHWSYQEYEGMGIVTFELFEKDAKTLLRLTNEGLSTFPGDIPEFKRESCVGGWEYFIKHNLKKYLSTS